MKNTRKIIVSLILLLIGFCTYMYVFAWNDHTIKINVKGSTTVEPYMQAIKSIYRDKFNLKIDAKGSGTGIKAIFDGTTDVAMSSRSLSSEEIKISKEKGIEVIKFARDGLVVIVNKDNSIENITQKQLIDLYTGKVNNWKPLNNMDQKVTIISRDESSGTREAFDSLLKITKTISESSLQIASTGQLINTVSKFKGSIGYSSLSINGDDIKKIKVDGVQATHENIKNEKYPLQRPLFLLYNKNNKNAADLINIIMSADGQKILSDNKRNLYFVSVK